MWTIFYLLVLSSLNWNIQDKNLSDIFIHIYVAAEFCLCQIKDGCKFSLKCQVDRNFDSSNLKTYYLDLWYTSIYHDN